MPVDFVEDIPNMHEGALLRWSADCQRFYMQSTGTVWLKDYAYTNWFSNGQVGIGCRTLLDSRPRCILSGWFTFLSYV